MAGKKRTKRDVKDWVAHTIRMPLELHEHLLNEAAKHHHSFNDEVVRKLLRTEFKEQQNAKYAALMSLEPAPDDPRTDQEIARQMEVVQQKYQASDWLKEKDELDSLDIDTEIEWLNPGGWSG